MDLLEGALKRSISWSIKNRRNKNKISIKAGALDNETGPCPMEKLNQKLQDQSHIRAFTTHFKIELNNLMDLKRRGRVCKEDSYSSSFDNNKDENDSDSNSLLSELDSEVEEILEAVKQYEEQALVGGVENGKALPLIRINGKHFGLYNIDVSEQQQLATTTTVIAAGVNDDDNNNLNQSNYSDTDDGYRSLSRNSGSKNNLIQQLNEIKTRLIDLLHEIDHHLESRLSREDIEAYTKRRNALLSKLDSLIDTNLERIENNEQSCSSAINKSNEFNINPNQNGTTPARLNSSNALKRQKSKSYSSLLLNKTNGIKKEENNYYGHCEYEEQVHVIDYNFARRASDSNSSDDNSKFQYFTKSNFNENSMQQPLIVSSNGKTKEEIKHSSNKYDHSRQKPIDFGAMMRNYESQPTTTIMNRFVETNKNFSENGTGNPSQPTAIASFQQPLMVRNKAQHVASNSSTSTYSASSHTSSSSFL